jgi:hypothetical protein
VFIALDEIPAIDYVVLLFLSVAGLLHFVSTHQKQLTTYTWLGVWKYDNNDSLQSIAGCPLPSQLSFTCKYFTG